MAYVYGSKLSENIFKIMWQWKEGVLAPFFIGGFA